MSKIGSAVSEEKSFENVNGRTHGGTDARTDDGRKVITIAHPEQSSGELKKYDLNFTLAGQTEAGMYTIERSYPKVGVGQILK